MSAEQERGPIFSDAEMVAGIKARYHNEPWIPTALTIAFSITDEQTLEIIKMWLEHGLIAAEEVEGATTHYRFREKSEEPDRNQPNIKRQFRATAIKETLNQIAFILDYQSPELKNKKTFTIAELQERTGREQALIIAALANINAAHFTSDGVLEASDKARRLLNSEIESFAKNTHKKKSESRFTPADKNKLLSFFEANKGIHFKAKYITRGKAMPGAEEKLKAIADALVKEGLIKTTNEVMPPNKIAQKTYFLE